MSTSSPPFEIILDSHIIRPSTYYSQHEGKRTVGKYERSSPTRCPPTGVRFRDAMKELWPAEILTTLPSASFTSMRGKAEESISSPLRMSLYTIIVDV
jgi:hypothetical protein